MSEATLKNQTQITSHLTCILPSQKVCQAPAMLIDISHLSVQQEHSEACVCVYSNCSLSGPACTLTVDIRVRFKSAYVRGNPDVCIYYKTQHYSVEKAAQ